MEGRAVPRARRAGCSACLFSRAGEGCSHLRSDTSDSCCLTQFAQIWWDCLICSLSSGPFPDPSHACFLSICRQSYWRAGRGGPHATMFVVGFLASVSWGTQVTRPRPPCLPGSCQKAELGTLLARAGDSSVVLTVSACDPVRRFLKQNPPL